MKIIHLSDTHLGPNSGMVKGIDATLRLKTLFQYLSVTERDADRVIITGDLAHQGEKEAYLTLQKHLADLPLPWRLIIGNHDHRQPFLDVFPDSPVDENGFIQWCEDTPAGRFIYLDSVEEDQSVGNLCPRRLDWLSRRLGESDTVKYWLVMHHAPMPVGQPNLDQYELRNAAALAEVIAPFRHRIGGILCGHIHRMVAGLWHGIPVFGQRALAYQWKVEYAPDIPIEEVTGLAGYSVIHIHGDSVLVHYEVMDEKRTMDPSTGSFSNDPT